MDVLTNQCAERRELVLDSSCLATDNQIPFSNPPGLHEPCLHVGIVLGKALRNGPIVCIEYQGCAIHRISESPCQDKHAAPVRFVNELQVLLPKDRPAFNEVVDDIVYQHVVHRRPFHF